MIKHLPLRKMLKFIYCKNILHLLTNSIIISNMNLLNQSINFYYQSHILAKYHILCMQLNSLFYHHLLSNNILYFRYLKPNINLLSFHCYNQNLHFQYNQIIMSLYNLHTLLALKRQSTSMRLSFRVLKLPQNNKSFKSLIMNSFK